MTNRLMSIRFSRVILVAMVSLFVSQASIGIVSALTTNQTAPVLATNTNHTISFKKVGSITKYVIAVINNPTTTRDTSYEYVSQGNGLAYSSVTNTYTWTPQAVPSKTINYGVRTNVSRAVWAKEVTINWPASVPVLTVNTNNTISFKKVGSTTNYVAAIVNNPTTTRDTSYVFLSEGNGLAYSSVTNTYTWTPQAVPGKTINYGMRTDTTGATWAKEVTINWPASVPVLTVNTNHTISFKKVAGVTNYVAAIVNNPTTTRDTSYVFLSEGNGLAYSNVTDSYTWVPQAVTGKTLNYSMRTDATGAVYSKEVAITWPAASLKVVPGTSANASGGNALFFYSNGRAKHTTTTPAVTGITVTARGDQCNGAPTMNVIVDGVQILSTSVSTTSYTPYTAPLTMTAGSHNVAIEYTNDADNPGVCDRNLIVDKVEFTPAPPSPPTPTPSPSPSGGPVLTLSADGKSITFPKVGSNTSYIGAIISNPTTTRDTTYVALSEGNGTLKPSGNGYIWTPSPIPGQTINYGIRTDDANAVWSQEVSISWSGTPTATPPTATGFKQGIIDQGDQGKARIKALGAEWSRDDFEGAPSTYKYDQFTAAGLKILPIIYGDPAGWVRTLPNVDVFEWTNEPYAGVNGPIGASPPEAVARSYKAAVIAARAVRPNVRLLLPTQEISSDQTIGNGWGAGSTERMFAAVPDLGNYLSGFAVHPYSRNSPLASASSSTYTFAGGVDPVRAVLVAHGLSNVPIWVTEVGFSTYDGGGDANYAQYLRDLKTATLARPWIEATFIYQLRDQQTPGTNREHTFGLLRNDWSEKPQAAAVREWYLP